MRAPGSPARGSTPGASRRARRGPPRRSVPAARRARWRPSSAYLGRAGESGVPRSSAATLAAVTAASVAPQATPCGIGRSAPSGDASPWTAPRPAFARQIPDRREARAIAERAAGAPGPSGSACQARSPSRAASRPARARESVTGDARERDVALEQLRHRVHAVRGDPGAVRPREEAGIDDRVCRDQSLVAERALVSRRATLADDGVPAGLAPGAGGRGHGDERHGRPGVGEPGADALEVVADARPGAEQAGDRLRRVEDAPAPDADDDLDRRGPVRVDGRVHDVRRGLVGHRDLARELQPRGGEPVQELLATAGRRQRPPAGDQQEAGAVRRREPRDAADRPLPERDPRQPAERERGDRRQLGHPGGVSGNSPT